MPVRCSIKCRTEISSLGPQSFPASRKHKVRVRLRLSFVSLDEVCLVFLEFVLCGAGGEIGLCVRGDRLESKDLVSWGSISR